MVSTGSCFFTCFVCTNMYFCFYCKKYVRCTYLIIVNIEQRNWWASICCLKSEALCSIRHRSRFIACIYRISHESGHASFLFGLFGGAEKNECILLGKESPMDWLLISNGEYLLYIFLWTYTSLPSSNSYWKEKDRITRQLWIGDANYLFVDRKFLSPLRLDKVDEL